MTASRLRRSLPYVPGLACLGVGIACLALAKARCEADGVVEIAYGFPDGKGYAPLTDSGVPDKVVFKGVQILPGSSAGSSYCCGFTFAVAMSAAEKRGLLLGKQPWHIKQFQREWYGATGESAYSQSAFALARLGIGREIPFSRARAGDFLTLWRGKSGHSVILLAPIREDGRVIGVQYRSSQPPHGVGDAVEYFRQDGDGYRASGFSDATVDSVVVGRMKCR